MADLLRADDPAFLDLFRQFEHTAFRLEVRRAYGVPEEDEGFQRFLAGRPVDLAWHEPWLKLMREQTGAGKRVDRVRVIDEPPSDYLRFSLHCTPYNNAAGEDIRYLPRRAAHEAELPDYDYWLFDSRRVAYLRFAPQDRFLGVVLDDAPQAAVQHGYWRDTAWHYALTLDQYTERATPAQS